MALNVKGNPSLNTRLYFSQSGTTRDALGQACTITLRKPTMRETFFRRLRNALTLGAWTPLVTNRKDWQAFRAAVTSQQMQRFQGRAGADGDQASINMLKQSIETAFSTYSSRQRLTASKASAIMQLIESDMSAGGAARPLKPAPQGGPVKVSQGLLARGLHTLDQRWFGRDHNRNVALLDTELQTLDANLRQLDLGEPVDLSKGDADGFVDAAIDEREFLSPEEIARLGVQRERLNIESKVADVRGILNLGYGVKPSLLRGGLTALQEQLGSQADKSLIYPGSSALPNLETHLADTRDPNPCEAHLKELAVALKGSAALQSQLASPAGTSSIVAIPLSLLGGRSRTHENHSVLVALDLKSRRVLYLDAKGESPRAAERHYANTQGLAQGLVDLGRSVFGAAWNPDTGMVMLSNAKQQGANDCVIFTHDFTRRLLEGQSVADIDRTMSELERDGRNHQAGDRHLPAGSAEVHGIRARMARDIIDHVLLPKIDNFNTQVEQWRSKQVDPDPNRNSEGNQV